MSTPNSTHTTPNSTNVTSTHTTSTNTTSTNTTSTHTSSDCRSSPWGTQIPEVDAGTVLSALDDDGCRRILEEVASESLTAPEISSRCDIPQSTTYRKVERLADAGLLEESIRIRSSGKHATEYRKSFDDVTVSVPGDGGIQLEITAGGPSESVVAIGR